MYSQGQQARSYYPSFNDQQRLPSAPHRPTSSGGFNSNYGHQSLNRSSHKLRNPSPQFPLGYNYPAQQRNNFSQSRVSMASSQASHLSNLANEPDIFPSELIFLLRSQEKNINNVKQKIEREKARVENDFSVFRAEIDHILQDVKLSVQAELDLVYKTYITKYAELKGEVQELRLMRKEILMNNHSTNGYTPKNASVSNKDLINEIEKDAEHMRNYRVYGYLGELQKQKLEPISMIANELMIVGAAECPFYKHKELTTKLKEVKSHFSGFIKEVFETLEEYVITPETLIEKDRFEMENTKTVLRDLDASDSTKLRPFDVHYPANSTVEDRTTKDMKKAKKLSFIGANQQGCVTRWCQDIKLNRLQRVQTDHNDSILCIHFLGDRYVVTGSKDTTINIYSLDGRKVKNLRGHEAAICCLASVRGSSGEILASGSDNGCGSVILWDPRSWNMISKIQAHEAAVTSIVDLGDGKHIATGSYDKKINIFTTSRSQKILSLSNRASVTGMVMTSDKQKLVTAGLDKSISVWNIIRKGGMVEAIVNEKVISNEELVCQLQPSHLRPEIVFCAGRDGTLRVLNIISGMVQKSYTVNANSLIELAAIQREMNPDSPILISCSGKDSALVSTKMQSGLSSLIKVPSGLGIDYGCGIGPKVVMSEARDGIVAIVNQRRDNKQFSLYQLELK